MTESAERASDSQASSHQSDQAPEGVVVFSKVEVEGDVEDFELLDNSSSPLPVAELQKNLSEFMAALAVILPATEKSPEGTRLKTIAVAVGINGKGKVGFLGTGVEVGATATLTLTFER